MNTITLYRPVGLKELQLIIAADWRAFPPRLDWQPIFYPVLNSEYACQIAQSWNTGDEFSGFMGAVTRFEVDEAFCAKYPVQNVGGQLHDELWVPAEELESFNNAIADKIEVERVFFGEQFAMPADAVTREVLSKFRQP